MKTKAPNNFKAADNFTELDRHFADFLLRLEDREEPHVWLAAALASQSTQSGHVCLDLTAISGKPILGIGEKREASTFAPELDPWVRALKQSCVVGAPGDFRPLILDQAGRLYLHRYWQYEKQLADFLKARAGLDLANVDVALLKAGLARLFPLQSGGEPNLQRQAAVTAVLRNFSVITGGPGTGKTSTVVRILALLLEQPAEGRSRIALAAPTGKAAARLKEAVKQAKAALNAPPEVLDRIPEEAFTLHRLLGALSNSTRFRHNRDNLLSYDVIVVDEASMIDLPLMAKLVDAIPSEAHLLLLGDRDQLASVEPGSVFGDICSAAEAAGSSLVFLKRVDECSATVPHASEPKGAGGPMQDSMTVLQKSYRFGAESGIGELSRCIQSGDGKAIRQLLSGNLMPDLVWQDMTTPSILQSRLEGWLLEAYSGYLKAATPAGAFASFSQSRILSALRKGPFGVVSINQLAEDILERKGLVRPRGAWYRGRPVMISQNDYQLRLFNGDIGIALEDLRPEPTLGVV
ncbi:MAG: exodeoxyribonuclease V subunit alpha, partial [Acidobacteria bacterium]|nr:exodeoxyribonuclease V subunit alpha [Acidobacteriota bacterium]